MYRRLPPHLQKALLSIRWQDRRLLLKIANANGRWRPNRSHVRSVRLLANRKLIAPVPAAYYTQFDEFDVTIDGRLAAEAVREEGWSKHTPLVRKFCPVCGKRCYRQPGHLGDVKIDYRICGSCPWQEVVSHTGPKNFRPPRMVLRTVCGPILTTRG